jgi:hypothetical protein
MRLADRSHAPVMGAADVDAFLTALGYLPSRSAAHYRSPGNAKPH